MQQSGNDSEKTQSHQEKLDTEQSEKSRKDSASLYSSDPKNKPSQIVQQPITGKTDLGTHHTPTSSISCNKISNKSEIYLTPIPNKAENSTAYGSGLTTVSPGRSNGRLNPFSNFDNSIKQREPLTSYRDRNSASNNKTPETENGNSSSKNNDRSSRNFVRKVSPFRLNTSKPLPKTPNGKSGGSNSSKK